MRTCFLISLVILMTACSPAEDSEADDLGTSLEGGTTRVAQADPAQLRSAADSAAGSMPKGAVRVQKAEVVDRHGFEKPMTAFTVLIPAGWRTEGGIVWQQNMSGCGKNTPHVAWRATSPDGLSAMEILPEETWSGNNTQGYNMPQQGCPNLWIRTAKEYIHTWVEHNRRGARVLEYRDRPDFVAALKKQLQQQQQVALPGMDFQQWAEGGQALIAYNQQGTEVRELIGIAVLFSLTRMQGVMPGEFQEILSMVSLPGFAMRAPDGHLDRKVSEMLRKSGRPNPQWQARMLQHQRKIAQINAKGAMDRSRIIAKTGDEIREMQRDSWEKRNASQDRMHREASEAIRGTETYKDPHYGGTVELDNSYDHAWQLNDGTYVLTDDPSFAPYAAIGQNGRQLTVAP